MYFVIAGTIIIALFTLSLCKAASKKRPPLSFDIDN